MAIKVATSKTVAVRFNSLYSSYLWIGKCAFISCCTIFPGNIQSVCLCVLKKRAYDSFFVLKIFNVHVFHLSVLHFRKVYLCRKVFRRFCWDCSSVCSFFFFSLFCQLSISLYVFRQDFSVRQIACGKVLRPIFFAVLAAFYVFYMVKLFFFFLCLFSRSSASVVLCFNF